MTQLMTVVTVAIKLMITVTMAVTTFSDDKSEVYRILKLN